MHNHGVHKVCPRRSLGSFRRGRDGNIAALVALLLAVLLGSAALSFDLGRAYDLNNEMQSAVDAVAIAAGSQLDNGAGARNRACLAGLGQAFVVTCSGTLNPANALVQNAQTFSTDGGGANIVGYTLTFWQTLGKDVSGNLNDPATSDANAEFVQVVATPRNVDLWFAGIVSAVSTVPVSARAVAGYGAALCQVPPMFVCQDGGVPFDATDVGKGIWMKGKNAGDGTAWSGGNFGLLALPGHTLSAAEVRDAMARVNPDAVCFGTGTQETKPGQTTDISVGMNVRFDIWENPLNGAGDKANAQYQPAADTVKGLVVGSSQCGFHPTNSQRWHHPADKFIGPTDPGVLDGYGAGTPVADRMGFPRDTCAYDDGLGGGPCNVTAGGSRFGDGVWDWRAYFEVNHAGYAGGDPNLDPDIDLDADGNATRWEVYLWEIDGHMPSEPSSDGEHCFTAGLPNALVPPNDRRLLCVAAIDCTGLGGGTQPVTVDQWLAVFLTEPIGIYDGDNNSVYVEIVSDTFCTGSAASVARHVVQLYE